MPYIHCDTYHFEIVDETTIFVGGVGAFHINDSELHAMYPNFASVEQMLKELTALKKLTAIIEELQALDLSELKKALGR